MKSAVTSGLSIYEEGLFDLNDIHKSSGAHNRHRPSIWLANANTQKLISTLGGQVYVQKGGNSTGTKAVKEVAIAYAEWVYGASFKSFIFSSIKDMDSILSAFSSFEIPDDMPDMFVYAIKESDSGNIKIGISRDPKRRLKQLQTGNSSKLELVAYAEAKNKYSDESFAHSINSDNHVRGEWFNEKASIGSLYE